jgi:dihydrofolate synthase/folylpolyglutamate synthase
MTYQQTVAYLFSQLPMFQAIGAKAFKKDLTNIKRLCAELSQPQNNYPTIHIAGTNGKGSTSHILAAVLQAHGLKVGLYTSPHYRDFRERIKINGQYVSEAFVIDFVADYHKSWEMIQPSFFEITVAMAFEYFAQQKIDIAVIETGLGGIYDSTNIITPILSVITNISFDHQEMLGDNLPQIAWSKAGIIKPNIPVVIGERQAEVVSVFESTAKANNAPIYFASDHYKVEKIASTWLTTTYNAYLDNSLKYEQLQTGLSGTYQQLNLQTSFQAIDLIPTSVCKIEEKQLRFALEHIKTLTNFIGRWQMIQESPLVVCDSAHNEAGIQQSMKELLSLSYQQLHLVIGVVKDKDLNKMIPYLPKSATYYFAKADIPRGLDAEILRQKAAVFERYGESYPSVAAAVAAAKANAKQNDIIYIGGSIFVVAEVI